MSEHQEYRELKRWIKVGRTTRWVSKRGYGYQTKEYLDTRMVSKLPPKDKRAWNDYYFPVTLKVPMFYEHEGMEVTVPPLPEGEVALELLKEEDE